MAYKNVIIPAKMTCVYYERFVNHRITVFYKYFCCRLLVSLLYQRAAGGWYMRKLWCLTLRKGLGYNSKK